MKTMLLAAAAFVALPAAAIAQTTPPDAAPPGATQTAPADATTTDATTTVRRVRPTRSSRRFDVDGSRATDARAPARCAERPTYVRLSPQ